MRSPRALGLIADTSSEPWVQWRSTIRLFLDTVVAHRALVIAVLEARESSTEIREAWNVLLQTWIDGVVTQIEQERARGAAPMNVAPSSLATTLCLMNERAVQHALAADASKEEWAAMLDTLTHVWVSSIYQPGRAQRVPLSWSPASTARQKFDATRANSSDCSICGA